MRERFFTYTEAEISEILDALPRGNEPKRGVHRRLFSMIENSERGPRDEVFTEKEKKEFRASKESEKRELRKVMTHLRHVLEFVDSLSEMETDGPDSAEDVEIARSATESLRNLERHLEKRENLAMYALAGTKSQKGSRHREYTEKLFNEIKRTWLDFGGLIDADNKRAYERFFLAVARPALSNKTIGDEFNVGLNPSTFSEHYKKAVQ